MSDGGYRATRAENEFLQVAATQGWPEIVDLQDLQQNNGFSSWQRYVSPDGSIYPYGTVHLGIRS